MRRPEIYDGQGTIIAFSEDGRTFTALPPLDKFEKMPSVGHYDRIDCLDSDGAIDVPVAVSNGDYIAEGPQDSRNPGIIAAHAYHQATLIVYYKVTLIDGSSPISGRCLITELAMGPRSFRLVIKDHNLQE